jgi:hypothetical protein
VCAIKSIKQYNLRGFSVGIADGKAVLMYAVERAAGGMIHMPNFLTVGSGI